LMPSIMAGIGAPKAPSAATLAPGAPPRRQPTPAFLAAAKADARGAGRAGSARTAAAASGAARTAAKAESTPRPEPVATASTAPPLRPAVSACAPDEQRIQNYAGRIVEGLDLAPEADLGLFAPDGRPQPNLTRVLLAMSAFELGYLRASVDLVEEAIERATAAEPMAGAPRPGP
jgi:hypothetical protein